MRQSGPSYFDKRRLGDHKRVVYSFWHQDILLLGYYGRNEGVRVLISQHRDGELIARIVEKLGFTTIRGSTTRGGMRALRTFDSIKDDPSNCDMAITPDGPKGPAKKLQKGVIFAAARTGFPVVPMGVAVDREWRFNSWDRFRVPKPFTRCYVQQGQEIPIPRDLDEQAMEDFRLKVEDAMLKTEDQANEALKNWKNSGIKSLKKKPLKCISL